MLNRSILAILITLSLSALCLSAPQLHLFAIRQVEDGDFYEVDPSEEHYYKYETSDEVNSDEVQVVLKDEYNNADERLAREVAEADYVPPPKHVYDTVVEPIQEPINEASVFQSPDSDEELGVMEQEEGDSQVKENSDELIKELQRQQEGLLEQLNAEYARQLKNSENTNEVHNNDEKNDFVRRVEVSEDETVNTYNDDSESEENESFE